MKNKVKKPKHYWCDTYKTNIFFHIGWSRPEFMAYASDKYGYERKDALGDGLSLEISNSNGIDYVVWSVKNDPSVIAHECLHVATMLFDRIGIHYSSDDSEPICYYLEKLVRLAIKKGA